MDDKAKIELEKEKKDAISFEAYKAALDEI